MSANAAAKRMAVASVPATMYASGQGVPQNYAEAMKWFRKAADQGNARAQHGIGVMYANGQGVPQNDAEAMRWYRMAADPKAGLNLVTTHSHAELLEHLEILRKGILI